MEEPAFPGGMLEGTAAGRDFSKLEMWFDRNLMRFKSQVLCPERSRPVRYCRWGLLTRKHLCGKGPGGSQGTPKFCGGQIEHKSAVRPCGSRAQLNTVLL